MSWPLVRDQLASIVEGTTPLTKKRGLPAKFKHQVEAREDGMLPDSRGFWFEVRGSAMNGKQSTISPPRRFRANVDLVVAYREDVDETLLAEAIMLDHQALCARLPDGSLWGRPASTIESLFLGSPLVVEMDVDRQEGWRAARYHLHPEFLAA